MSYRGEIDGLKALAILSIVLFHYDTGIGGGYVGIDVFLVVIGFLVASTVKAEIEAGPFRFLAFYEQGMRRLLPALLVVLALVLAAGFILQSPVAFTHLAKTGAFASLGISNIFFYLDSSHFNGEAAKLPLLHTWSVGAVEQFYIILPLLLVALRKARPALILAVLAGLAAISFLWGSWYLTVSQTGGFYLLPSRAWELLAGSLLAYAPRLKVNPVLAGAIGLGGLAMILVAVISFNTLMFYPGKKGLIPVIGAMAVIYSVIAGGGITAKALALKPFAFIGRISYSWFLWHWPLIAFYKYLGLDAGPLWPRLLLMAISFALAVASWRFLEQPFRNGAEARPLKPLLIGIVASITAAAAFGIVVAADGLPGRGAGPVAASGGVHQHEVASGR